MIVFPNAKINIGLQVLRKRPDGYHEIETLFYPIKLYDVLEVVESRKTALYLTGIQIEDQEVEDNICLKAYHLLKNNFKLPSIDIHLHKNIPIGAGLGGGSSDAAFMLKLLNELFELKIGTERLEEYAKELGADCPFFIKNQPVYASGVGTSFAEFDINLKEYQIVVVNPRIHINTAVAYQSIVTNNSRKGLKFQLMEDVFKWKDTIVNDFEPSAFEKHPEIKNIKDLLYRSGAVYSAMSGSGSSVYGLFENKIIQEDIDAKYEVFYC